MPLKPRIRQQIATQDMTIHRPAEPSATFTVEPLETVSSSTPTLTVKVLIREKYSHEGKPTLRWWREEFWLWDGRRYGVISDTELESIILRWLEGRIGNLKPRHATEVMRCLRAECLVRSSVNPPAFIKPDGHEERHDIIAFENGLADIGVLTSQVKTIPHTPEWFSMTVLPFEFDPDAVCIRWEGFLDEVLDDDESIDLLQRWFGYLLTQDTSQQKLLLFVGPTRAGKGTVGRVIKEVFGDDNVTSPPLYSLGAEFGLQPLIGKSIALLPDAHLSRRADAMRILEILKGIVGEDAVNVNRKHLPHLTNIRLRLRFVIVVNDLPDFSDPSGAFAARLCILPFPNSFVGMEDKMLEQELRREAPGILNWAIEGYKRLRKKGEFNVPRSAIELHDSYRRSTSPIRAFIEDCCVLGAGYVTLVDDIYTCYLAWARANGHEPLGKTKFGQRLRHDGVRLERQRLRRNGQARRPHYCGIGITKQGARSSFDPVPSCPQGQDTDERYKARIKRDYEEEKERLSRKTPGTAGDKLSKRLDRAKSPRIGTRSRSKVNPDGESA